MLYLTLYELLSKVLPSGCRQQSRSKTVHPRKSLQINRWRRVVLACQSEWWRFDYRFQSKYKTLSMSGYPAIRLKDARDRRDKSKII